MSLTLREDDLRRIQRALHTLLSPLNCGDLAVWLRACCIAVREAMDTDAAAVLWTAGAAPLAFSDGALTLDSANRFAADWRDQVVGVQRRRAHGLRTWVREDVWSRPEVIRSAYYNEYCVPAGFRDSAGMSNCGTNEEYLVAYIASATDARFERAGREAMLLRVLQPALEAGAQVQKQFMTSWELLHAIEMPICLYDLGGRLLHANHAFVSLSKMSNSRNLLWDAAQRLAAQVGRLEEPRRARRTGTTLPAMIWTSPDGRVTLRATLCEPSGLGPSPFCVITAEASPALSGATTEPPRWGFTPREREVAMQIARGASNNAIARALHISEHTARHHTENVLRKLEVHSRAEAVAKLSAKSLKAAP